MLTEPNGMPRGPQTPPFDGYISPWKSKRRHVARALYPSPPPPLSLRPPPTRPPRRAAGEHTRAPHARITGGALQLCGKDITGCTGTHTTQGHATH